MIASGIGGVIVVGDRPFGAGDGAVGPASAFDLAAWQVTGGIVPTRAAPATVRVVDLGRPGGDHEFMFPTAVLDLAGRIHVLWAEPPRAARQQARSLAGADLVSLWHAVYARGRWTPAELVGRFDRLLWNPQSHSNAVALRDGSVVVAVPVFESGRGTIIAARWSHRRWRLTAATPRGVAEPAYAALGTGERLTLVLAYVAPAPGAGTARDVNSVFVARSRDGGATWGPPQLVHRSGSAPIAEPQLATVDRVQVLLMPQRRPGSFDVDRLWMKISTNGGRSWRAAPGPALSRPRGPRMLTACGRLVVVASEGDLQHSRLVFSAREHGQWGPSSALFPELLSFAPRASADRAGCVHLVWVAAPRDSVNFTAAIPPPPPRTTYSTSCFGPGGELVPG